MTTQNYTGWTIRFGFLDGNLLDGNEHGIDLAATARAFRGAVEEALISAYPGAEVLVEFQERCSGSLPSTLRPMAFTPDGDTDEREAANVCRIAKEVSLADCIVDA